jgi:hypothetical protein
VEVTGPGAAGGGDEVSVEVAVDPDVQPASVAVAVAPVAVVASPVAAVAHPAAVPPVVAVVPVPCGSVVVVPVDVPSTGGAEVVSVAVVPGSALVDVSAGVPVDVGSPVVEVVVSVDVVVVSEPAVAAGGVVPVSAAAGYAATPTPTSMATTTANRAAKEHSNRLNWSLWATALLLPTISRLLPRQSRPLVSATIVRFACPLVMTRTDWENTPRRPKRTALKT